MRVDVHGGASVGVAETFLAELDARSTLRKDTGIQMPQAVQTEAPDLGSILRGVQNLI